LELTSHSFFLVIISNTSRKWIGTIYFVVVDETSGFDNSLLLLFVRWSVIPTK
jgi:hypothetical protein